MEQKSLAKWLHAILIGIAFCGLLVLFVIIPEMGKDLVDSAPEFSYCYLPWLMFIWAAGIPCFVILYLGWKISTNIGKDQSFTEINAQYLKWISWLAAGDALFFFAGNIVLMFLNMNHPGFLIISLLVIFVAVSVAVLAAALSHMVKKAAALQQESDLTI